MTKTGASMVLRIGKSVKQREQSVLTPARVGDATAAHQHAKASQLQTAAADFDATGERAASMLDRREALAGGLGLASALAMGIAGSSLTPTPTFAAATNRVRITALRFGSVQWLLEAIKANNLAEANNIQLDVKKVASSQAGPIALLSGDADVIVSDWPWAMRQLARGEDVRFAPYSSALGAVMVAPDSEAKSVLDLKGKRLGVAGSAIDKSFILLKAYTKKTFNVDLLDLVQPVYGAPPLLAEEMRSGRIDAVLNFWNYTARLEGAGFKTLIGMADVMAGLGVAPPPPLVGFVWTTRFERSNPGAVSGLLAAVADANNLLARDDAAWEKVRPGMRAKSEAEFKALRATYRAGIPEPWTGAYTASAAALLELLSSLGQKDLIGAKTRFDPKLFNGTS